MENGYDHHDHQDIFTYNLSVPKRFTLDVPNQSPPLIEGVVEDTGKGWDARDEYARVHPWAKIVSTKAGEEAPGKGNQSNL